MKGSGVEIQKFEQVLEMPNNEWTGSAREFVAGQLQQEKNTAATILQFYWHKRIIFLLAWVGGILGAVVITAVLNLQGGLSIT